MQPEQYIFAGLIILCGCAIQTAVGFGAGLFVIPIMVWAGFELTRTIAILNVAVLLQSAWGMWFVRAEIPWRKGMPINVLRLGLLPVGVWMLAAMLQGDPRHIKLTIGAILLAAVLVQLLAKVKPRRHVPWGWTLLAGSTSGLMLGLVGIGGPPVVLWAVAHDWTNRQLRGLMWSTFVIVTIPFMLILWWRFGSVILEGTLAGLILAPTALGGTALGLWLGDKLSISRLRQATYLLLIVIAIATIIEAVV